MQATSGLPYHLWLQMRPHLSQLFTSQSVFSFVKPGPMDIPFQPAPIPP